VTMRVCLREGGQRALDRGNWRRDLRTGKREQANSLATACGYPFPGEGSTFLQEGSTFSHEGNTFPREGKTFPFRDQFRRYCISQAIQNDSLPGHFISPGSGESCSSQGLINSFNYFCTLLFYCRKESFF